MKSLLLKSCAVALVTAAAGAFTSPAEAACGAKAYGSTCGVTSTPLYGGSAYGAWKGPTWNTPSNCGYTPCHRPKPPVVVQKPVIQYRDRVVDRPVAVPVPRPYPVRIAVPVKVPVPVPVERRIAVPVPHPVPVRVPVAVHHRVPVPVHVGIPVRVPVPVDRPVAVPVRVPVAVHHRIPVPVQVPVPVHTGNACGGGQYVDPICGGGQGGGHGVPYAGHGFGQQGGFAHGGFAGGFGGQAFAHGGFSQHGALGFGQYGGLAGPLVHGASERISRISAQIADGQNTGLLSESEAKTLRADIQKVTNTIDEARKKGTQITAEHEVHGKIAGLEQRMFHAMLSGSNQFGGHGFGGGFASGFGGGFGAPLGFGGHGFGGHGFEGFGPAQPPVPANWRF